MLKFIKCFLLINSTVSTTVTPVWMCCICSIVSGSYISDVAKVGTGRA